MTAVSDAARVRIVISDYALADAANKVNILGAGITVIGIPEHDPRQNLQGASAPFAVSAWLTVPPELAGTEAEVELSLVDRDGHLVIHGPSPEQQQPVTFNNKLTMQPPNVDLTMFGIPEQTLLPRVQWVLTFPTGIIVPPGPLVWKMTVDGVSKHDWQEPMYIAKIIQRPVSADSASDPSPAGT